MGVKIVKDVNKVPELLEAIKELEKSSVDIGVMGDSAGNYKDGMSVLGVAKIQEFGATITRSKGGTVRIPERPFIRGTADNKEKEINQQVVAMLEQVIQLDISPIVALNAIGESAVGITKEYMTALKEPPNSPVTIALKESSNPLLDTMQLRGSITHRVNK